jgi:hypothetical protein
MTATMLPYTQDDTPDYHSNFEPPYYDGAGMYPDPSPNEFAFDANIIANVSDMALSLVWLMIVSQ